MLSEGYLLFFADEGCFRRMQGSRGRVKVDNEDENGEAGGKEDAPKSCVDMSQCLLRWDAKSKNRSVHLVFHKSRFM